MRMEQKELVEENIKVVRQVISQSISPNENITGLGYEDLFQEGCLALCKASWSYSKMEIPFSAYARRVIRNALIDYCRRIKRRYVQESPVDFDTVDERLLAEKADIFIPETMDFTLQDADDLLNEVKMDYTGCLKKGVNVLRLKLMGMNSAEIARHYGVRPQLVGAWTSKATKKLRANSEILWKLKSERKVNEL